MADVLANIRPYTQGDRDALSRLLDGVRAWPPTAPSIHEEVFARWKRRNVQPEDDVSVLPGPMGEPIAYSQASLFKDGTSRLSFEVGVHPDFRRRGIGSTLYKQVEARASALNVQFLTCPLLVAVGESSPECREFLEDRGFRREHSYWQMRIDDIQAQPAPQWPAGVTYRLFGSKDTQEADAERWAELIQQAFEEPASPHTVMLQLSEPGVSPDGYIFAVDPKTGEEIGTSRARIDEIGGRRIGYVGTVGVLPKWRGRGIARALILSTLAYLSAKGMRSAILYVSDTNSAARALYASMGWRAVYRTDHYWKRLREA